MGIQEDLNLLINKYSVQKGKPFTNTSIGHPKKSLYIPEEDYDEFLRIYIDYKREDLIKEISLRTKKMIKDGALNEVKRFLKLKIKKDKSINKVIGIDELTQYLNKEINLNESQELISIKTRQYAKRQATWARSRMASWKKIKPSAIKTYLKNLKKTSLKLDQLT